MRRLRVHNSSRDALLADRAQIADSSKTRKTGLLKHERLEPGDGIGGHRPTSSECRRADHLG